MKWFGFAATRFAEFRLQRVSTLCILKSSTKWWRMNGLWTVVLCKINATTTHSSWNRCGYDKMCTVCVEEGNRLLFLQDQFAVNRLYGDGGGSGGAVFFCIVLLLLFFLYEIRCLFEWKFQISQVANCSLFLLCLTCASLSTTKAQIEEDEA